MESVGPEGKKIVADCWMRCHETELLLIKSNPYWSYTLFAGSGSVTSEVH